MHRARKWCYVRVSKCASSAIRAGLGTNNTAGLKMNHVHTPASDMLELNGEAFLQCFRFSFIRNPWDRVVSLWHHRMGRSQILPSHEFKRYVMESPLGQRRFGYSYRDMLCDQDDQLLVHWVGRYERLDTDWAYLQQLIYGVREETLPRKNISHAREQRPYQDYYDDETREKVRRSYAMDLELFPYYEF